MKVGKNKIILNQQFIGRGRGDSHKSNNEYFSESTKQRPLGSNGKISLGSNLNLKNIKKHHPDSKNNYQKILEDSQNKMTGLIKSAREPKSKKDIDNVDKKSSKSKIPKDLSKEIFQSQKHSLSYFNKNRVS